MKAAIAIHPDIILIVATIQAFRIIPMMQ